MLSGAQTKNKECDTVCDSTMNMGVAVGSADSTDGTPGGGKSTLLHLLAGMLAGFSRYYLGMST